MFTGEAEEAIRVYSSVLPDTRVESIERYAAGQDGPEGSLKLATVLLAGNRYRFYNSPIKHEFGFTPSISLFVDCDSREQLDACVAVLGEGGSMLMPPNNYGFSQWFYWLNDKWGVSWQLNLP